MQDLIKGGDIYFLVSFMTIIMVGFVVMIRIIDERKKYRYKSYDDDRNRIIMEESRKYLESKIYQLENDLMANQKRWESVNHLILSSQQNNNIDLSSNAVSENINLSTFLINAGITKEDLVTEKDLIFLLTPFHIEKYSVTSLIKDICNDVGLRCSRGDEEHVSENILSHVLKMILKSRLIIANIDGRNPNVFYELGICHAIGKPIIIISKTKEDVPFDINAKNIIFYNDEEELNKKLRNALTKVLVKN